MNIAPTILVLEDERLQILTLRSQLADIGTLKEFSDPESALIFARSYRCDAAIIDIRMRRKSMDGLAFLKILRGFDAELSVIIRTADSSERVVDGAMELRVMRRAIKAKTSMIELRRLTVEAIGETARSRDIITKAADASRLRTKLERFSAGQMEDHAICALSNYLAQSLRKKLNNLSVLASLIRIGAAEAKHGLLAEQADRSAASIREIACLIDAYLKNSFTSGSRETASVNESLALLGKFFSVCEPWTSQATKLAIRPPKVETLARCSSLRLFGSLKTIIEYFLARSINRNVISISTRRISNQDLQKNILENAVIISPYSGIDPKDWISLIVSGDIDMKTECDNCFCSEDELSKEQNQWSNIGLCGDMILARILGKESTMELVIPISDIGTKSNSVN